MPGYTPQIAAPVPPSTYQQTMRSHRRKLLALTSLGLAGLVAGLLSGCSNLSQAAAPVASTAEAYSAVNGNWRFTAKNAVPIDLAGALAVTGTQVSGRLHVMAGPCVSSTGAAFTVSGAIDGTGHLLLKGDDDASNVFEISGLLAPDQRSLQEPTVTVAGSCSADRVLRGRNSSASTAQQYQPVTGSYAGTFSDSDGDSLAVNASLTQPTTPDANGVYHLTGSATFANVPCIGSAVVTDSTVTGDQITATYTNNASGATIVGTGTFSADAQTLTVANWTLSGGCGSGSGTGILTHQ